MRKRIWAVVFGTYAAVITGYCVHQFQKYRNSFEKLVPYTHAVQTTAPAAETTAAVTTAVCTTTAVPETSVTSTAAVTTVSAAFTTMTTVTAVSEQIPTTTATTTTFTVAVTETVQTTETTAVQFPLDLNTATLEELSALPGIGPETAQAILDYRAIHGRFSSRQELLDVSGIGEVRFQAIYELLYIENEQPYTEAEPQDPETPPETVPETEPAEIPIINLNTADKETLMQLSGCGETEAEAILRLRNEIQVFHNPLELLMADEISDALYLQWEPYLAVDDEGSTQLP